VRLLLLPPLLPHVEGPREPHRLVDEYHLDLAARHGGGRNPWYSCERSGYGRRGHDGAARVVKAALLLSGGQGRRNSGRQARARTAPPRPERMTRGEEKKIETNRYACVMGGNGG
jgi:hypothetical protein